MTGGTEFQEAAEAPKKNEDIQENPEKQAEIKEAAEQAERTTAAVETPKVFIEEMDYEAAETLETAVVESIGPVETSAKIETPPSVTLEGAGVEGRVTIGRAAEEDGGPKTEDREAIIDSNDGTSAEAIIDSNDREVIIDSNDREAIIDSNDGISAEAIIDSNDTNFVEGGENLVAAEPPTWSGQMDQGGSEELDRQITEGKPGVNVTDDAAANMDIVGELNEFQNMVGNEKGQKNIPGSSPASPGQPGSPDKNLGGGPASSALGLDLDGNTGETPSGPSSGDGGGGAGEIGSSGPHMRGPDDSRFPDETESPAGKSEATPSASELSSTGGLPTDDTFEIPMPDDMPGMAGIEGQLPASQPSPGGLEVGSIEAVEQTIPETGDPPLTDSSDDGSELPQPPSLDDYMIPKTDADGNVVVDADGNPIYVPDMDAYSTAMDEYISLLTGSEQEEAGQDTSDASAEIQEEIDELKNRMAELGTMVQDQNDLYTRLVTIQSYGADIDGYGNMNPIFTLPINIYEKQNDGSYIIVNYGIQVGFSGGNLTENIALVEQNRASLINDFTDLAQDIQNLTNELTILNMESNTSAEE